MITAIWVYPLLGISEAFLMLNHPAMSRQSVNLLKINYRDFLKRCEPNRNSTEELCKIIKASILNPSGRLVQLMKVKFIHDLFQDIRNLFSRVYSNKGTFMGPK